MKSGSKFKTVLSLRNLEEVVSRKVEREDSGEGLHNVTQCF